MSKRPDAMNEPMSKIENAKNAPVLQDAELDGVSGGFSWGVTNPGSYAVKVQESLSLNFTAVDIQ